jgi:hypothetical protein
MARLVTCSTSTPHFWTHAGDGSGEVKSFRILLAPSSSLLLGRDKNRLSIRLPVLLIGFVFGSTTLTKACELTLVVPTWKLFRDNVGISSGTFRHLYEQYECKYE